MLIIENWSIELLNVFFLVMVQELKDISCGILKLKRLS
jgi:hypothetical protein